MNTFIINGKQYKAKEFTFNLICDLEMLGVNVSSAKDNPKSFYRAYLALCGDMDLQTAGWEIESHLINGGDLLEMDGVISDMSDTSKLFKALAERKDVEECKGIRLIHSK